MKFLRHLLGITKLDKEKNQCIRQKNGIIEHSKGNKTVPEKVATTCTEDGHKETTKTSTTILFLSFRLVLNVNYSFLGNSPASEF